DVTVSGEEDGSKVTFDFPNDYDYWYVYEGSGSFKDSMYSNYLSSSSWSKSYKAGVSYSLKLSDFDDGNVTLYVVGIDEDDVASTGKLEVALDSYDIEYSGTAGTTVTFEQDDFTDMLEEAAEDAGLIGKRNSTAYVEFDYVTFSPLPSSTKEGVLYNGSSKISKSTKCTDLDKVTFEIASKADSQVYIKFTVTAKYYKDDKSSTKATSKDFSGRVLVKVVHEDIKYTVPVDGSVVFKAADFQDFYDDTHKNGTLSYVKFTELPKVTDGALYATYSAIYAGTVAKTSDKFYYDSSKASDYDLDDVTFRTSMWSKAGTKIYIPFEAYGTTSKNSKTVSGTPVKGWVAITVENARTMNFTDVKTSDWFYNNVKNAYTMGLIEGKTTTTFNPDDNMTYAEAVTLAARMNQLYYSGKVTLSNSTTGNWYSSYESYAISKGIISSALGNKANTKITRKDYVDIFYNALPASAYTVRNTVSSIPDLANNTANAKVYAFYRAGILTGYANTPGKTNGAFGPNDNIKRSEVATILIRMMDSGTRVYFTM
ncbi:MAG: S-layer homology domain-containing protein, partial [Hominicoprocola sp.]